jgi:hypothetical protein
MAAVDHCPELEHRNSFAMETKPMAPVDDRRAVIEPDGKGNENEEWRQKYDQKQARAKVSGPLCRAVR